MSTAAQNKFNLSFDQESLVQFLLDAKKNTYASASDRYKTKPLLSGSKQLEYSKGDFFYRDIYVGEGFFSGQEIVYYKNTPVWSMTYAGQIYTTASPDEINTIANHLHKSLALVEHTAPYRGPARYDNNQCSYINQYRGSIFTFSGEELIMLKNKTLYDLRYSGGCLR